MKRILSLILCVVLLSSTALLFTSCGTKAVDFTDYRIVYGKDVSDTTAAEIQAFATDFSAKVGEKIGVKKVDPASDEDAGEEREILVGNTNRPETAKALKKIKGHGYIITVIGKKLVIVGTTNLLTSIAMEYFADTYFVGSEKQATLDIKTEKSQNLEMMELTKSWKFVYSHYLDGEADALIEDIKSTKKIIEEFSDVRGSSLALKADTEAAVAEEILVGVVERDERKELTATMDANNYSIAVKNGKIVVAGLNDAMILKAMYSFREILRDSVAEIDGNRCIFLPTDLLRVYTDAEAAVVTDFPRPEGVQLTSTIDIHDGMEYYYEGADLSAYNNYCATLISAGYTLYSDNTIEDSVFRIYNNVGKNVTLYVAYNAFKHAEAQGTGHKAAIRIVASALDCVKQLDSSYLSETMPTFTKLSTAFTAVTAVRLDYSSATEKQGVYGNLFVVTLEDGSFVLFDGGMSLDADCERIYSVLSDLYKRTHNGQKPTRNDPIRISAWYLSHGHGDHYGAMQMFIKKYVAAYNSYYITIDRLIANFPSDEELYNSEAGDFVNTSMRNKHAELSALVKDKDGEAPGFEYIKVHTGQTFWLANVEFEVLYTHEDQYPRRIHVYNNSTTVIRMNIHHTDGTNITEGSSTTMLWLGDAQQDSSTWMRATYGEYLASDMVQIGHHGWNSVEWSFYKLVKPVCAFWPNSRNSWSKSFYGAAPAEVGNGCSYRVIHQLTSLQYIILCDDCNYTVQITANGPDFSIGGQTGIFNAGETKGVTMSTVSSHNTSFMKTAHNKS